MFVAVDGEVVGTGVVECWGFPLPGVSPCGLSILRTVAPGSASHMEQSGPARTREKSAMVIPSGMFMVSIQPQLFADSNIKLVIFYDFFVLISIHGC